MKRRRTLSLRARLVLGAGSIAGLAVLAAFLFIYGATESARRIDEAVAAQRRMELLSILSARVGEYGMVAAEAGRPGSRSQEERIALLQRRAELVEDAFQRLDVALGDSVLEAREQDEAEQMRRATRGLGLARMRAQFERFVRTLAEHDGMDESRLRGALDTFATQFSPHLDHAIAGERRDRDAAFASAAQFRQRLIWAAWGVVGLAILLLALFHMLLVRPLMGRIGKITEAARSIGGESDAAQLAIETRDEMGLLFANLNRTAARIGRRRKAVDADRRQLNAIIAARTEELEAANRSLQEADTRRRRFFADVSHELRTPLTAILGEAELGMRAPDLSEDQARESMSLILKRARRLHRRVDDLLRVARSESGEIDLACKPFDAMAAASDAADDLSALAARRRLNLHVSGAETAWALGDRDWTRQVIGGLIDNAIRHSPENSRIDVEVGIEGAQIRIAVRDQGDGIAPEDQVTVFERFARATERPGFGVGLSLARWVVERQSGSVALRSPVTDPADGAGPGTEVILRLPRAEEDS